MRRGIWTLTVGLASSALIAGCSGKFTYSPPTPPSSPATSITIKSSRQEAWRTLIPELAKTFFVINNLDQASGLINVSYAGDPERFIDCGRISSKVSNLRGERHYDFPGSRAQQRYEIMNESGLYYVDRTMSLDGRVNIVLEEISPSATRMTVNIRYVLTRRMRIQAAGGGGPQETVETVSFGPGERASFSPPRTGPATTCQSADVFERQLLDLVPER